MEQDDIFLMEEREYYWHRGRYMCDKLTLKALS